MSLRLVRAAVLPALGLMGAALLAGPAAALAPGMAPPVAGPSVALVAAAVPISAELGACSDDGVTVVVDLTDLGGDVRVGCAPGEQETGTEALRAAGFTDTRDAATMICAIDDHPDPCPATFEGSFWAYWQADADGDWQQAMAGSDTTEPAVGQVEGWRYNDGSEGPSLTPAEAVARVAEAGGPGSGGTGAQEPGAGSPGADEPAAEEPGAEEPTAAEPDSVDAEEPEAGATTSDDEGSGISAVLVVALAVVLAAVVALAVRRRRSAAEG